MTLLNRADRHHTALHLLPPYTKMPKLKHLLFNKWTVLTIAVMVIVALFFFNPTDYSVAPKCIFKLVTGWDCPGCGFQRAAHAFLHGRLLEAVSYNFFLVYAIPFLLLIILTEYVWKGEKQARWRKRVESPAALNFYVASYILWGVIRNLYGW